METKINIAKILNDKPEGTKLWTDMFGIVTLYVVTDACDAFQVKHHNKEPWFDEDGKLYKEGVLCIYPSKSMRNWSKFAWEKGDVLVSKDGNAHVIFEGFDDDTYETFNGNNYLWKNEGITMCFGEYEDELPTSDFSKANQEDAQKYIHQIEKRLGYKLNFETLKIEKQPEFKDGDIVCISGMGYLAYGIVKIIDNSSKKLEYYVLNDMSTLKFEDWLSFEDKQIQPITETQRIILFDALANEGKAWDSDKKAIVDLKPKVELKPFDKVLVRDGKDEIWEPAFFFRYLSQFSGYNYQTVGGEWRVYCIPYIGNESLLGTTKDVEG